MNVLYHAHSGLRYLVLLAAVVAIAYHVYGLLAKRPVDGAARVTALSFTGLLDLQVVLGLILMATGIFHGALIGHMVMMLLAAAAAHVGGKVARRAPEPSSYYKISVGSIVVALVLIVLGIAAIGRTAFESNIPLS